MVKARQRGLPRTFLIIDNALQLVLKRFDRGGGFFLRFGIIFTGPTGIIKFCLVDSKRFVFFVDCFAYRVNFFFLFCRSIDQVFGVCRFLVHFIHQVFVILRKFDDLIINIRERFLIDVPIAPFILPELDTGLLQSLSHFIQRVKIRLSEIILFGDVSQHHIIFLDFIL